MKIGVLICVLMLAGLVTRAGVQEGAFEPARRIANAKRGFFIFSTSFGKYTIRHDGMGELAVNGKRRPFFLTQKIRLVGRLEQMYFREHQGDLLLLYQVSDGSVYLARMIQESKKIRWFTPVKGNAPGPCVVEGNEAHCGEADNVTKIDLDKGVYLSAN
jgi:hypothetical protein